MANQEHLTKLLQGVKEWNAWRQQHPEITPDLSGVEIDKRIHGGTDEWGRRQNGELRYVNFERAVLSGAKFRFFGLVGANFIQAVLAGADLSESYLDGANFSGADLSGVDFSGAKLVRARFSGAVLDGAIFTQDQLVGILGAMGIRVRKPSEGGGGGE